MRLQRFYQANVQQREDEYRQDNIKYSIHDCVIHHLVCIVKPMPRDIDLCSEGCAVVGRYLFDLKLHEFWNVVQWLL